MSTVMPEGKRIRDALRWISEQSGESGETDGQDRLVQDAVFRFNLTPKEEAYLYRLFKNSPSDEN